MRAERSLCHNRQSSMDGFATNSVDLRHSHQDLPVLPDGSITG